MIDYRTENFVELLKDVDVVFDTMGGASQIDSFKVLKPKTGRMISIVGAAEEGLAEKYDVYFDSIWLKPNGEQLSKIAELMEAGKVKSIIGATFPFSQEGLYDAHALSETHHAVGKIVIEFK